MSLIGNPVKIGDGPAAVTPPFSVIDGKGNSFSLCMPLGPLTKPGKAAGRAGESEDLPGQTALTARTFVGRPIYG